MAKDASLLIAEERTPSYLNRQMITGAKVGLVGALGATAIVAATAVTGGLTAIVGAPAILLGLTGGALVTAGAGAGCIRGKESIARNHLQGRSVSPPTFFNEGMANGLLNGAIIGLGAIALATIAPAALPWVAGVAAAGTAGIAYAQGKQHQTHMAAEYELAKSKAIGQDQSMFSKMTDIALDTGKAIGKTAQATVGAASGLANTAIDAAQVTAQESAELASKLKEGVRENTNWREAVSKSEQAQQERGA